MKKKRSILLFRYIALFLLLILCQNPQRASAETEDFTYDISESGITLTGYTGGAKNLIIPQQISGNMVVGIGENAFSGSMELTSVVIPESVLYMGNNAFSNCIHLISVRFMGDAPSMGGQAFSGCKSELVVYYEANKSGFTNPWNGVASSVYSPVTGVTLDTSEMVLLTGKTKTVFPTVFPLNATNREVNWTSSNPDAAVVDSIGQVTALAGGKTEITVITEDGAFSAVCEVIVVDPMQAPTGEFAVPKDYNRVELSWKKSANATGYDIYRYKKSTRKYHKVATVTKTTFEDSGLKINTRYKYKIRAFRTLQDKTFYSNYSPVILANTLKKGKGSTLFLYMSSLKNRNSVYKKAVQIHYGDPSNTCAITVSEALRRIGFQIPLYSNRTNHVEDRLISMGWKRKMDLTQMQPGDIVFTADVNGKLLGGHATHVFIFMGWANKEKTLMNICDNQFSRFGAVLHERTIYETELFDKTAFFYNAD